MSALVMFLADASKVITDGANAACGGANGSCNQGLDMATLFRNIANIMIYLIGALSVIMIIYGGFRYTISRGDKAAIESAKNTILYAVIGVFVALISFAIVNFVVTSIGKSGKKTSAPSQLVMTLHNGSAYANVTSSRV